MGYDSCRLCLSCVELLLHGGSSCCFSLGNRDACVSSLSIVGFQDAALGRSVGLAELLIQLNLVERMSALGDPGILSGSTGLERACFNSSRGIRSGCSRSVGRNRGRTFAVGIVHKDRGVGGSCRSRLVSAQKLVDKALLRSFLYFRSFPVEAQIHRTIRRCGVNHGDPLLPVLLLNILNGKHLGGGFLRNGIRGIVVVKRIFRFLAKAFPLLVIFIQIKEDCTPDDQYDAD